LIGRIGVFFTKSHFSRITVYLLMSISIKYYWCIYFPCDFSLNSLAFDYCSQKTDQSNFS